MKFVNPSMVTHIIKRSPLASGKALVDAGKCQFNVEWSDGESYTYRRQQGRQMVDDMRAKGYVVIQRGWIAPVFCVHYDRKGIKTIFVNAEHEQQTLCVSASDFQWPRAWSLFWDNWNAKVRDTDQHSNLMIAYRNTAWSYAAH